MQYGFSLGTMVVAADHVNRVLKGSTIPLLLYTGHMMIGGTDIVVFAKDYSDRIAHSHLKDVSSAIAIKVRSHEVSYYDGMVAGRYTSLGQGDAKVIEIVRNSI